MPVKQAGPIKVDDRIHNIIRCLAAIRNVPGRVVAREIIDRAIRRTSGGTEMLALAKKKGVESSKEA
jgi:hypothetical protein